MREQPIVSSDILEPGAGRGVDAVLARALEPDHGERRLREDHAGGAECQERARKAAGTRADLQHRHAGECSRGAGYARREIEVEQEILSEGFFGDEVMPANNFA